MVQAGRTKNAGGGIGLATKGKRQITKLATITQQIMKDYFEQLIKQKDDVQK
jgi:hypothetical protein